MTRIYFLVIFTLTIAWPGCSDSEKELVKSLDEVITPLPDCSPQGYEDRYLESLLPWENYSVIGLGEATHGTMDFFELKQRLFRFLVEHHHCGVLAYEYSYRKSLIVDDYIHHKHDNLDSLFKGDLWIQDNETVRQFIEWIREYNEGAEEQDLIHFIGIDNQVDAMVLEEVLQQIQAYLPTLQLQRELFPCNVEGKKEVKYEDMSNTDYEEIKYALLQLKNRLDSICTAHTDPRALSRKNIALQLVRSLQDSHEFLYLLFAEGKNIRDRQLAENVQRIVQAGEGDQKVAVWAHNAHVASNPHYLPDGSPSMGWYLRDSYKEKYLSVATSFSVGQFTAVMLDSAGADTPPMTCKIREEPPQGSLNAIFYQARFPQFFLNIRDLDPDSPLYHFFDEDRPMIGVGDLYLGSPELHFTDDRIINLVRAHDLLFYYHDTRPLL